MKKECSFFSISIFLLSNCLQAADRDGDKITSVSNPLDDSIQKSKKILIFFGPPFAGQKELYNSVKCLLSGYGKRTFLVSEELSEQKKAVLRRAGISMSFKKTPMKPLIPVQSAADMMLEDTSEMPHGYDISKYMKSMSFLTEVRNRLNNPDNSTCFYAMLFWTKDKIVGRRFREFLDDYPGQYLLIKIMSDLDKAETRLAAHVLRTSKLAATELSLQKIELAQGYAGQKKKFTVLDDAQFHIQINTTKLSEPIKETKNIQPLTSPRTGAIEILDPLSPRRLERSTSAGLKIRGSGYDDEAAKIIFLLNLKTDAQELQQRVQ